jgi:hypothetical protein
MKWKYIFYENKEQNKVAANISRKNYGTDQNKTIFI